MAAGADGPSQRSLHSACSSSSPLLFLSGRFTDERALLPSSFPFFLFCCPPCAAEIVSFSLAFSSLVPVPAVLTVPCYFPLSSALIGWLFVCTNPCSLCLSAVISGLPPSRLHLRSAHVFGNLSPRPAGITDCPGDGLQDRPSVPGSLTHIYLQKSTWRQQSFRLIRQTCQIITVNNITMIIFICTTT